MSKRESTAPPPKDASKKLGEPRPTTETADYLVTLAGDADMNKAMDTA